MNDTMLSLNDEQAIRAVRLFYDFAPRELWKGGEKPSPERLKIIAGALVKEAPADVQPAVAALAEDGQTDNIAARAQVCRLILTQLRQSSKFERYVDLALDAARKPVMAIDPVTGAFIIILLLSTSVVEPTPHGRKFRFAGGVVDAIKALHLPESLHELPAVMKALPDGVWNALMHLKG